MNPSRPNRCPFAAAARAAPGSITLHPLAAVDPASTARFRPDSHMIALLSAAAAAVTRLPDLTRDFYAELFTAHPALRSLFPPDLAPQERKLADMFHSIVQGLSAPESTRQSLAALGALHHAKGVLPEHYPPVCRALLNVMRRRAGPDWTREMESEMARALDLISTLMLAGVNPALPTPSAAPPATPAPPASPLPPSSG